MKDFQYEGAMMTVKPGEKKVLRIPPQDVAFLDKKYVLVTGTSDLSNIEVLIGVGETNINLVEFPDLIITNSPNTDSHIINIPIPTNNLTIVVNNTSERNNINVAFYGGSA